MLMIINSCLFGAHMPVNGVWVPEQAQTEQDFYYLRLDDVAVAGPDVIPFLIMAPMLPPRSMQR